MEPITVYCMDRMKLISLLLRIGIATAFLYPPVAAYLNPDGWIWFVPDFVEVFISKELFLTLFGIVELAIGAAILVMPNPLIPALAAAGVLGAIIVLDWNAFDVIFRDIAILLSCIALILLPRETPHRHESGAVEPVTN